MEEPQYLDTELLMDPLVAFPDQAKHLINKKTINK
jgi:hypothetical protein